MDISPRVFKVNFLLIGIFIIVSAVVFFLYMSKESQLKTFVQSRENNPEIKFMQSEYISSYDELTHKITVTDSFYKLIQDAPYNEVKTKTNGVINLPDLQQIDIKERYQREILKGYYPVNYQISFNGSELSQYTIKLNRGDGILILNTSDQNVSYSIKNTSKNGEILSKLQTIQVFDFKGAYELILIIDHKEYVLLIEVI